MHELRVRGRRLHYYVASFGWSKGAGLWLREMVSPAETPIRAPSRYCANEVIVRLNTSDIDVFFQIFVMEEYRLPEGIERPRAIIDAGGNTGYAALYFATTYPEVEKIVCIEPEASNFEVLRANAANVSRILPLKAALTNKSGYFSLVDTGWGKWAFQVAYEPAASGGVRGITVDEVMREASLESVDLLKVDIEGGEKELFEGETAWLDRVGSLAVELHDRMKPGCSRAFYSKLGDFPNELHRGETIYAWR